MGRRALPDMGDLADVSEFLTKSGYGSVPPPPHTHPPPLPHLYPPSAWTPHPCMPLPQVKLPLGAGPPRHHQSHACSLRLAGLLPQPRPPPFLCPPFPSAEHGPARARIAPEGVLQGRQSLTRLQLNLKVVSLKG